MSSHEPKLIVGTDSIYKIPELLTKDGIQRVQVITTAGFMRRGSLTKLFEEFENENIHVTIFSNVMPDPTIACVEEAIRMYRKGKCNAIVAIGGGSVIDCAKVVGARIAKPNMTVDEMSGILKIRRTLPYIYAVPTTAGTGSEVTAGAVITDGDTHYKHTLNDFCLIPKYAILDPVLTCNLPSSITSVTGIDALTHAVEAYTNRFASPKAKKSARNAVKMVYENLPIVYKDGKNIKAREKMLLASYYGGVAITNAFVGYVHAIAHGIGGLYGITHGQANAIILPYVLEGYGKCVEKKLAELSDVVGIPGNSQSEKTKRFIDSLRSMNKMMDIPETIAELNEKDFHTLIDRAIHEGNPTYPVPMIWDEKQFRQILRCLS
ncbi:MAG TPA: iron-containing alcohol dehydrogenase [Lachnospiraceae bacterium]|nr:iron-containing alcohol dehydrogenase [Lachnospiraceae bacterium]